MSSYFIEHMQHILNDIVTLKSLYFYYQRCCITHATEEKNSIHHFSCACGVMYTDINSLTLSIYYVLSWDLCWALTKLFMIAMQLQCTMISSLSFQVKPYYLTNSSQRSGTVSLCNYSTQLLLQITKKKKNNQQML